MRRWVWMVAAAAAGWAGAQAVEAAPAKPRADSYFYSGDWKKAGCAENKVELHSVITADLDCLAKHHSDFEKVGLAGGVEAARPACRAQLDGVSKRLTACEPARAPELIASYEAAIREAVVAEFLKAFFLKDDQDAPDTTKATMARLSDYVACVLSEAHARHTPGRGKDDLLAEAKTVCAADREALRQLAQANMAEGGADAALKLADEAASGLLYAEMKTQPAHP